MEKITPVKTFDIIKYHNLPRAWDMKMKPQLLQKFRYPNLISQILRVGQFCIDVYSIGTFKSPDFLQILYKRYHRFDQILHNWRYIRF